jgi:hypothetical protein
MSACIPSAHFTVVPAATSRITMAVDVSVGAFRLPTDALKYVDLTFDGVVAGSEIRAYMQSDGTELFGVESCDADHTFSGVSYFGTGQDVTIRIVNSAYRIKEFTYTIPAVDQVIPIQMEADKWYSNPA